MFSLPGYVVQVSGESLARRHIRCLELARDLNHHSNSMRFLEKAGHVQRLRKTPPQQTSIV